MATRSQSSQPRTILSAYRIMWLMVMFDLPVVSKQERRAATEFRNSLLDMGFQMSQFSVYLRCCTSPAQIQTYCKRVEQVLPANGRVTILQFTDKQYASIISYHGGRAKDVKKNPDQFDLF